MFGLGRLVVGVWLGWAGCIVIGGGCWLYAMSIVVLSLVRSVDRSDFSFELALNKESV